MLWCPTCQEGGLRATKPARGDAPILEGELVCESCSRTYPMLEGMPALMPQIPLTSNDWEVWREHLKKFQARREERVANPDAVTQLAEKKSKPQRPFANFTRITEGT